MTNLKNLFTEADFELLNQAIDNYPKSDIGMEMFGEILIGSFCKSDEEKEKNEKERKERLDKNAKERQKKEEECLELKFKLLQFKKIITSSEEEKIDVEH